MQLADGVYTLLLVDIDTAIITFNADDAIERMLVGLFLRWRHIPRGCNRVTASVP
jgi:hypothetical protein